MKSNEYRKKYYNTPKNSYKKYSKKYRKFPFRKEIQTINKNIWCLQKELLIKKCALDENLDFSLEWEKYKKEKFLKRKRNNKLLNKKKLELKEKSLNNEEFEEAYNEYYFKRNKRLLNKQQKILNNLINESETN